MSDEPKDEPSLARGERLQLMVDKPELEAIDDFRFTNRMPSRAAATRELLRRGLAAIGYTIDHASDEGFGVLRSNSVTDPKR